MPLDLSALTPKEAITAIYVGYYDRAPDAQGLEFWLGRYNEFLDGAEDGDAGLSLAGIAERFSSAIETRDKYPFFDAPNVADAEAFITSVYQNLFNRDPDASGLAHWSGKLASGAIPVGEIIIRIIEGAQDNGPGFNDRQTVLNKIEVGCDWVVSAANAGITTSTNPLAEQENGGLNILDQEAYDSATSILDGVTDSPASVTAALAAVDDFIDGYGNDAPVASNDAAVVAEDAVLNDFVSATDPDGDDLAYSVEPGDGPSNGTLVMNDNGTYTYTPDADFAGSDSFTYTVTDPSGETDTATVSLTVTNVNDAPVASGVVGSTDEDTAVVITPSFTDVDAGDTATISIAAAPANGTAVVNADGTITYTPAADYNGPDSFTYTVTDAAGASSSATANITVRAVNDAPEAPDAPVALSMVEDETLNGQLPGTDVDGDALTFAVASGPSNGNLTVNPNTGEFTYTPDADFNGSDTFTYTVTDPSGASDTATVNVAIAAQDDILTPGQDDLQGGQGDDLYLATESTLQTGDAIDGGEGSDTLKLSIQNPSNIFNLIPFNVAPTLNSVETVEVNGPNLNPGTFLTFDLSNADGVQNLVSNQTTELGNGNNSSLSFLDIQNVNATDISIIDTNIDHFYTYDSNGYESLFGGLFDTPVSPGDDDQADILVQEVNGSNITLSNENTVPGTPGGDLRSHIDVVNIDSQARSQVNTTTFNYVQSLTVGPVFTHLNVTGNADFEIEEFLEGPTAFGNTVIGGVNTVDARTLDGDLRLDLIGQGRQVVDGGASGGQTPFDITGGGNPTNPDGLLTVLGSKGDNDIDVNGNTNGMFTFQGGQDLLEVGIVSDADDASPTGTPTANDLVYGDLTIDMGENDDTVLLNITGIQDVTLGGGNDDLIVNGNVDNLGSRGFNDGVSMINAGLGNDSVVLNGIVPDGSQTALADLDNDYNVMLGGGNDSLIVNGGGDNIVTGEAGNDTITINGNGNQNIDSGADADTIAVNGDGNQIINSGEGNDGVSINGNGFHDILLGGGDDNLSIVGSRLSQNNVDNALTDEYTNINAGEGNDTVLVDGDHLLNVILGTGVDSIELNAEELTVDDIIQGGPDGIVPDADVDTVILNNDTGDVQSGFVGRSETSSITAVEVYDLRDENISLLLSSDNFDTALNNDITVKTTEANFTNIPQVSSVGPQLFQGMSRVEYEQVADFWFGSPFTTVDFEVAQLNAFLHANGVASVDFFNADASVPNDGQSFVNGLLQPIYTNTSPFFSLPSPDSVTFQSGPTGFMLVDITDTPMSVASGRNFTLEGGNIQDIIVADDASISSRLTLNYDATPNTLHSVEDTLRVVDGAQISAADLRNVNGLEIVDLVSESNNAQTWQVELTDRVINQTTSNADFIIRVDPQVPSGTQLFIQIDPSVYSNTASKNVVIESNSNVEVYVNGSLVTQPQYGQDLIPLVNNGAGNPTGATVIVNQQLLFTENADNLIGTPGDDTFIATSLDQLQAGDIADGLGGQDTLILDGIAVSNPALSLWNQLDFVGLANIEEIVFETGQNVQFDTIDGGATVLENQLNTIVTGSGDDTVINVAPIGSNRSEGWFLGDGDDTFDAADSSDTVSNAHYVDGGRGYDQVNEISDADDLFGTDVEYVRLDDGGDAFLRTIGGVDVNPGNGQEELVIDGSDDTTTGDSDENFVDLETSIRKASDGTLANVFLNDIEDLDDLGGDNIMFMDSARVVGDDGDIVARLNAGNDSLTVTNADDVTVTATTGTKTVNVGLAFNNVDSLTYTGGTGILSGVDNIVAIVDENATVDAGGLDDNVNVTSTDGGFTVDIDGGAGNDTLTGTATAGGGGTVLLDGGVGDDVLTASGLAIAATGGDGADTINITTLNADISLTNAGRGIDSVMLNVAVNGGSDRVIFGDINYTPLQAVDTGATFANFIQFGEGQDAAHQASLENGIDMITGFNAEPAGAGAQDVLDFSPMVVDDNPTGVPDASDIAYGDWTGGVNNVGGVGGGAEIAVIAVNNGFTLSAADVATAGVGAEVGVKVADNGERIVVLARDTDGLGGFDVADLYLVQDIDQGLGRVWAVDQFATVAFATDIGTVNTLDENNLFVG